MSKITQWMDSQSAKEDAFFQGIVETVREAGPVKSALAFAGVASVVVAVAVGYKALVDDIPNRLNSEASTSFNP